MRFLLIPIITVLALNFTKVQTSLVTIEDCETPSSEDYKNSTHNFIVAVYKAVARRTKVNFVFSSHSIWMTLAGIAEGSSEETQKQIFKLLNLPADLCIRQKYYKIASTRIIPEDLSIVNSRALLIDEDLALNPTWHNFVTDNALLDVVTAPIKKNPNITRNEIKRIMVGNVPNLKFGGNSVILDALDYNGLWTTAFSDAEIKRAPFYSQEGEELGSVDLMAIRRKVRMGFVKSLNAKVLELPVGPDNKYRMLFFMVLDKRNLGDIIEEADDDIVFEMFDSLKESNLPIEIAIPRTEVTGEVDIKEVLADLGMTSIWNDEEATKYISSPAALPSSYVQRTTVILNEKGINPPTVEEVPFPGICSGLDPQIGTDFIANQPFLMGLFDAETLTPLIAVAFTKPTYLKKTAGDFKTV